MIAAVIMAAAVALHPGMAQGAVPTPSGLDGVAAMERWDAEQGARLDVFVEVEPAELAASMPEDIRHLAADVVRICRREGVNARFIAAVMRWERRPDLHNFFGWMGSNGRLMRFDTDLDCLERVIPLIKKLYLTPGGKYFHGATVEGVSVCYNNSDVWRETIRKTMEARI